VNRDGCDVSAICASLELGCEPGRIHRQDAQRTALFSNGREPLGQLPSDWIGSLIDDA